MSRNPDPEYLGRELLEAAGIEVNGAEPWDIQVRDTRFFSRVLRDRELGLGEAYQEGWWDAERLDEFLARVMLADIRSQIRPNASLIWLGVKARLVNRQDVRRARRNASAHYDIGNDLYERMLDRRMLYSCAYWDGRDCLEAAQEAKLELICRKLHLEPGMSVLDIGCGWGGFAAYAAQEWGAHVTGISPAAEQIKVAAERCAGTGATIQQLDYREVSGTYDRIVSVGMLEHVGPKNLQTFFDVCKARLAPDGLMLHHTIGSNETKDRPDPWFDRYIFPGGVVPSLEQISGAALEHWAIEDVHNFGQDYDKTLLAWSDNIEARWSEIPHYDEKFRRTWNYYLLSSAASFRVRTLQLWQIVCSRTRRRSAVYRATR